MIYPWLVWQSLAYSISSLFNILSYNFIVSEKFSLIIQEKDETDLRPVFTDEGFFLYTDTYSLTYLLTHSLIYSLAN